MRTITINTKFKIPSNFFESNTVCINTLRKISEDVFKNRIMNGGRKSRYRKIKKNNTRKHKKISGGAKSAIMGFSGFFLLLVIFLTFNPLTIKSLMTTKDSRVISKIVDASKNAALYENKNGTCVSNVLYFFNAISLETHRHHLLNSVSMTHGDIIEKLNFKGTFKTIWLEFSMFDALDDFIPESSEKDKNIYEYVDNEKTSDLTKRYIEKLRKICANMGKGFVTVLTYPTKKSYHAVILWYTETDNIVLIDPQLFYEHNIIEIFSDINEDFERYNAGTGIKVYSLNTYVGRNVDLRSMFRETYILKEKHFEIEGMEEFTTKMIGEEIVEE